MSQVGGGLETVRWRDGKVRILDQTRLPASEHYRFLRDLDEVCDAIRTLAVRGAPAIGVAGALGLALAAMLMRSEAAGHGSGGSRTALFLQEMERAAARLVRVRPTAVNLGWACRRVLATLREAAARGADVEVLRKRALEEAEQILEEDLALSRAMASHGAPLLPKEGRILTHCNTGGLATAGGGTALGVVLEAARQGCRLFVHVDETRPLLQGARLTAWELQRAGIPYAVQVDGAAAWLMRSRRVDAVLVGADRVAANGDTANKLGTYSLALAAREHRVPFYVVAPRSSFDPTLEGGDLIPIEERPPEEVLRWGDTLIAPPTAAAWNPAFDVTPARLITAWVTERGVEKPPFSSP